MSCQRLRLLERWLMRIMVRVMCMWLLLLWWRRRESLRAITWLRMANDLVLLNLGIKPILSASIGVEISHLISHVVRYIWLPFHGHMWCHNACPRSW